MNSLNINQENLPKPFSGKIFFFLGISNRWGTKERTILKDCLICRDAGATVYLYTYRDSTIDIKAKKAGLKCFYHHGKIQTKFFNWHKLRKLSNLLKELNVNVVHVYDIKILWPLCFHMRSMPLVPLVYTLSSELKSYYRGVFYKPLSERVDQVLLPMSEMVENVWGHMGIPPRKIHFVGMSMKTNLGEKKPTPPFKFDDNRYYIGTNLNGIETNTHFLDSIFHALRVMIEKKLDDKTYTFAICNERHWSECLLTDELRRQVKDWGLEENVAFVNSPDMSHYQEHIDLWFGLQRREDLEDYAIQALLAGKPVCVPRTAFSMEVLSGSGVLGETYKIGDSREIREKCEKILRNLDYYQKSINNANQALVQKYGEEVYKESLLKIYENLLLRRKRLWTARQKRKIRHFNPLNK